MAEHAHALTIFAAVRAGRIANDVVTQRGLNVPTFIDSGLGEPRRAVQTLLFARRHKEYRCRIAWSIGEDAGQFEHGRCPGAIVVCARRVSLSIHAVAVTRIVVTEDDVHPIRCLRHHPRNDHYDVDDLDSVGNAARWWLRMAHELNRNVASTGGFGDRLQLIAQPTSGRADTADIGGCIGERMASAERCEPIDRVAQMFG